MRDYEALLIVNPMLDQEATEGVLTKLKNLINKNDGKVARMNEWGKRRLAHPIDKHTDGYYALIDFEGGSKTISELDRIAKITDDVLRHMITKKEE